MGVGLAASDTWSSGPLTIATAKPCDSCKTTQSSIFCRADAAFLCLACDAKVHAVNKLASRHARVWLCEVCEQSPAAVTCRADAASMCTACDRDVHSANPLARRHERRPVVPFYDAAEKPSLTADQPSSPPPNGKGEEEPYSDDLGGGGGYGDLFSDDVESYLDLDLMVGCGEHMHNQAATNDQVKAPAGYNGGDGVVPVEFGSGHYPGPTVDGYPAYDADYGSAKHGDMYNFAAQSMSQSVSSSSFDVGVVPQQHQNQMNEISETIKKNDSLPPIPLSGIDREARVLRYKEKRKNRKFEKTIRYASRKAYAETRPRIKGRFAKRTSEIDEADSLLNVDAPPPSYAVVPTY